MDQEKIAILEKAFRIVAAIDNDDELYEYLLDETDAKPANTRHDLGSLIEGLKMYNQDHPPVQ